MTFIFYFKDKMDTSYDSVCDEKFNNWEPLDFEYSNAMKRLENIRDLELSKSRRDLDDLDVEEELRLYNHNP